MYPSYRLDAQCTRAASARGAVGRPRGNVALRRYHALLPTRFRPHRNLVLQRHRHTNSLGGRRVWQRNKITVRTKSNDRGRLEGIRKRVGTAAGFRTRRSASLPFRREIVCAVWERWPVVTTRWRRPPSRHRGAWGRRGNRRRGGARCPGGRLRRGWGWRRAPSRLPRRGGCRR